MTDKARAEFSPWAILVSWSFFATVSCGGGGGGGGSGQEPLGEITISGLALAREIETVEGFFAYSPLTTVRSNPLTGLVDRSTVDTVFGGDLDELESVALDDDYDAIVIPRNGTLVISFSEVVDPESVIPDVIDDDGVLVTQGSVIVRDEDSNPIPVRLRASGRRVFVTPDPSRIVGFPPSPIEFDGLGRIEIPERGRIYLSVPLQGDSLVRGEGGEKLEARADGLGTSSRPIQFVPGNAYLDFVEQNNYGPVQRRFNGFLPDDQPPRLIRELTEEGTLTLNDTAFFDSFFIAQASFDIDAKGGLGEWASGLLVIRPESETEERHVIERNDRNRVYLVSAFDLLPSLGDSWKLIRAELFEPDLDSPIDEDLFDPNNGENVRNSRLSNFVTFIEVDEFGEEEDVNNDGKTEYRSNEDIPNPSLIRLQFSEPMDLNSMQPYESLRVQESGDSNQNWDQIGRAILKDGGRTAFFVPERIDPEDEEANESVGYGPRGGVRQLSIQTAYDPFSLRSRLNPQDTAEFLAKGFLLVSDASGLPLGFPESQFDPDQILITYSLSFSVDEDLALPDVGVVVHRFQGTPSIENDPKSGVSGIKYFDQEGIYGPSTLEFNSSIQGRLVPASVTILRRVLDDDPDNAPPDTNYAPFADAGVGTPLFFQFGGRFQHVFRREAASISPGGDLAGSPMDLMRVYFAPYGGQLSEDVYEDVSVHVAHSNVRPDITLDTFGAPLFPNSGLGKAFDTSDYNSEFCSDGSQESANYVGTLKTVVAKGTRWTLSPSTLQSFTGSAYSFHPWPEFQESFEYDNDRSLLIEYRIRPQTTSLSFANTSVFSPATNFTPPLPRFRVFSWSFNDAQLDPDNSADVRTRCASGPLSNGGEFGDNARYFSAFDYIKRKYVMVSPWVYADRMTKDLVASGVRPTWLPAQVNPPLSELSEIASIRVEYRGADDPSMEDPSWLTGAEKVDGYWIQFRVLVTLSGEGAKLPSIESIALPYEIPGS